MDLRSQWQPLQVARSIPRHMGTCLPRIDPWSPRRLRNREPESKSQFEKSILVLFSNMFGPNLQKL